MKKKKKKSLKKFFFMDIYIYIYILELLIFLLPNILARLFTPHEQSFRSDWVKTEANVEPVSTSLPTSLHFPFFNDATCVGIPAASTQQPPVLDAPLTFSLKPVGKGTKFPWLELQGVDRGRISDYMTSVFQMSPFYTFLIFLIIWLLNWRHVCF